MACIPCNKSKNTFLEKKNAEIINRVSVPVPQLPVQISAPVATTATAPKNPHSDTPKQFVIVSKINRIQQHLEDIKKFEAGLKS